MVSGEDCTYNDATEYSNVTSLQSDTSCIINTNIPESECVKKENINFEQLNLKDCKCYDVYSQANCGVPPEHCVRPNTVEESPKDLEKNQYTMKQMEPTTPCLCRAHKINAYTLPLKHKNGSCSRPFWCRFKWKWPKKSYLEQKDAMYEVNLRPTKCPHYSEPFMYCEISEGIPNRRKQNYSKVTKPEVKEKEKEKDKQEKMSEKIEIYYFDHGNSAYYRTTDSPPILATERCAEKTDQAATRFWAEIFGTIHIGTAFVTAFILQFLRFILYSIIRPLTVGILQMLADYFIKPCLSIVFNALIQPVLILLYNIATSLKDLCEPIAEAIGLFLREVANVCAAIRIVEVKQGTASSAVCT